MWPKHDKNIPRTGTHGQTNKQTNRQTASKWDKRRKTQENSPKKGCSKNIYRNTAKKKNKNKNKIVAPSAPVTDSFEHHHPNLCPLLLLLLFLWLPWGGVINFWRIFDAELVKIRTMGLDCARWLVGLYWSGWPRAFPFNKVNGLVTKQQRKMVKNTGTASEIGRPDHQRSSIKVGPNGSGSCTTKQKKKPWT